jgi:hypothetical protein
LRTSFAANQTEDSPQPGFQLFLHIRPRRQQDYEPPGLRGIAQLLRQLDAKPERTGRLVGLACKQRTAGEKDCGGNRSEWIQTHWFRPPGFLSHRHGDSRLNDALANLDVHGNGAAGGRVFRNARVELHESLH